MKDITTEEAIEILKNVIQKYKESYQFQNVINTDIIALEKVLNELDTLQNGFNTAVEHQTKLIRENSHFRYELFNNQKELEEKDKIINAMALQLSGISIWDNQKEDPIILVSEDAVKKYYERKVKDDSMGI